LTGVDALPADADVAAQKQHREKQLRLVLHQTLARLTPAERTALDYAALLPPDGIPSPWLRELVEQEHPDALAKRQGYDAPGKPCAAGSKGCACSRPATTSKSPVCIAWSRPMCGNGPVNEENKCSATCARLFRRYRFGC
jgi:hypothetical protein